MLNASVNDGRGGTFLRKLKLGIHVRDDSKFYKNEFIIGRSRPSEWRLPEAVENLGT